MTTKLVCDECGAVVANVDATLHPLVASLRAGDRCPDRFLGRCDVGVLRECYESNTDQPLQFPGEDTILQL